MNKPCIKHAMKRITKFAIPVTLTSMLNVLSLFIAMMMVARISKHELAAGALATSTYVALMTFVTTTLYSISILISHIIGQQKNKCEIGRIVQNGFWVGVTLTLPASLLLWHADKILLLFKQDPHLISLTTTYFHFMAFTLFTTMTSMITNQFFNGIGRPKLNFVFALIRLPITILLTYIFVFGKWGAPQLALGGIGCAQLIVQTAYLIAMLFFVWYTGFSEEYGFFQSSMLPDKTLYKKVINMGLPIGIQFSAEIGAMTIATYFVGFFGVAPLAASQIVGQYSMILVMVNLGISQSMSVFVSEYFGQQQFIYIKYYVQAAALILCAVFAIVNLIFWILPIPLVDLYLDSKQSTHSAIIHYAIYFFIIAGLYLFIDGFRNMFAGTLRGLHDSKAPMQVGVVSLWLVSLPLAYLVGVGLDLGPIGVRLAFISGFIIATCLLALRLRKTLRTITQTTKA